MNYRHAYHAGNFADVFKHTILIGLLQALEKKSTPFCYVDTHAGAGRYDLRGSKALKTGEAAEGFLRLLGAPLPPPLQTYVDIVTAAGGNPRSGFDGTYPGSPLIASALLRANDRAVLCELDAEEAEVLKQLLAGDARFGVHQRDGYAALGALLPPKERRGLVLVDPPFEAQDSEFRTIEAAMKAALARWPTGIYAIWYPIKRREHIRPFHRWFAVRDIGNVLAAELVLHPGNSPLRLNGCGMLVINPPWKFDEFLRELLPQLHRVLAPERKSDWRVEWIARA